MKNNTRTALLALATLVGWSVTASAQLDPLTLIRRVPPTVIIVLDTSLAMLQDGSGNLYDPGFYSRTADPAVMGSFPNITSGVTYRRIFKGFAYSSTGKYTATTITASATFARARKLITFDAVPEGQQATRMSPTARLGSKCSRCAMAQPESGMMV